MLQQIIGEAKVLEAEAIKAEDHAQQNYEAFVKETNQSIEAKQDGITNKNAQKAKTEQDLTAAKEDLQGKATEIEQLGADATALHESCDFVLKNFDIRQSARDEEVEALREAR